MLDHAWPADSVGGFVKGDDVVLAMAHDDLFIGAQAPMGRNVDRSYGRPRGVVRGPVL